MAAATSRAQVLIVEDDPSMADVLRLILQRSGIDSEIATSAGAALVSLEDDCLPESVILDVRLPDASGLLVLRRIRRDNLPIRVAVVSGITDPRDSIDVRLLKPDAFFRKPIDNAALVRWVQGK